MTQRDVPSSMTRCERRMPGCLFCEFAADTRESILQNEYFFARYDSFPVSRGHVLVIPLRHVESPFELSESEGAALVRILGEVAGLLEIEREPSGYNLGVNVGEAGGQTVKHLHVHVIPRYQGDIPNPAGGIRKIIPNLVEYP